MGRGNVPSVGASFQCIQTSYTMISFFRRTPPNALVIGIYTLLIAFAVLAFMNPQ